MSINIQSTNQGGLSFLNDNSGVFKVQGQLNSTLNATTCRLFSVKGSTLNSQVFTITSNAITLNLNSTIDDLSLFTTSERTAPSISYLNIYGFVTGATTGDKITLLLLESDELSAGDTTATLNIVDSGEILVNVTPTTTTFQNTLKQERGTSANRIYTLAIAGQSSNNPTNVYIVAQMVFGKFLT
tara:strand:+ start:4654 stop:5208 length:555 start_codon:yes stop_codon:yes gene_type:complete